MADPPTEPLSGLTLEQHAGLTAALAEGFPPADVLALEGLDDKAFQAADAAWKGKLATDGADGPTFKAYREKLAAAEDWLSRPVDPLDADLTAWMAFLGAYGVHASPFDLLQQLGLGLNDLSRLSRRWQKRLAEDRELEKQAAEIAKKQLKKAPNVRVKEAKLRPFPWSKGAEKAALAKAAERRDGAPIPDDEFGLDKYASVSAELSLDPKGAERILARYGISRADLEAIEARWRERIEADSALERDWRQLYAFYHSRFAASAKRVEVMAEEAKKGAARDAEPSAAQTPVVPPKPIFASTSLSLSIPRGALLPFVAGKAPPEIAEPTPEAAKAERPKADFGGTALALDVPRGPALPFEGLGPPAPPPDPKLFAGTALALDVPRGPSLPFVEGDAPEVISKPSPAEEEGKRARRDFGGTSLAIELPAAPATPFEDDAEAAAARRKANPFAQMSLNIDVQALLKKAASAPPKASPLAATSLLVEGAAPSTPHEEKAKAPPPPTSVLPVMTEPEPPAPEKAPSAPPVPAAPSPVPSWAPELTLEQHASLTVEIATAPDRAAEVLTRYRVTAEQKARLDEHYRREVAAAPEARAAWERAYNAYYAWLSQARSSG